jgi:hypothetical protein
MSKLLPLVLTLLCACETAVTPVPGSFQILDITPREHVQDEPTSITVQLDVEPRFHVNYGEQVARMIEKPVLELGSRTAISLDTYLGHGQFQGTVGPGLAVGLHEIRVKLGDGREASFPDAYEVRDPNEAPAPVAGYWFDSIPDQYVNEPFTVVIHAEGTHAERFNGKVTVLIYQEGVPTGFSVQTSRFSRGVVRHDLSIPAPGNYLVVVQDAQNRSATSNSFQVHAKN